MLFKIHYSYVNISLPAIIIPASYLGRHDNNLKYAVPAATIDPYKFSFFPKNHSSLEPTTMCSSQCNICGCFPGGCSTSYQTAAASGRFQATVAKDAWFLLARITTFLIVLYLHCLPLHFHCTASQCGHTPTTIPV